jgi:hypothetical protein
MVLWELLKYLPDRFINDKKIDDQRKKCLGSYLPIIIFSPSLKIMDHIFVRVWRKVRATTLRLKVF